MIIQRSGAGAWGLREECTIRCEGITIQMDAEHARGVAMYKT